jgi:hypothetical protein
MRLKLFMSAYLCFCFHYDFSFAQNNVNENITPKNEFMIWGGVSPDSNKLIGMTENARLGVMALRYARLFRPGRHIHLKYTMDAIPVSYLSFPTTAGDDTLGIEEKRKSVYGWGFSPVGLQINFGRQRKLQPFISTSGGFIYFSEPVPSALGKNFNFTADFGIGVQYFLRDNKAVTIGYKYHHLSNAYRGEENPGFDSNLFYVGFSFFK